MKCNMNYEVVCDNLVIAEFLNKGDAEMFFDLVEETFEDCCFVLREITD